MEVKSYLHINFSTKFRKRFVQTYLYNLSKVRGNVLMLCGPALASHLSDAKIIMNGGGGPKCYIYEIDKKTYNSNVKDLLLHKDRNNFIIYNRDIITAKICRFIDLDFCKTLDSTYSTIKIMYNKLNKLASHRNKHLLITFANRNNKGIKREDDIVKLCKLFNISNSFTRDKSIPGLLKFNHTKVNATYIAYQDTTPMTTFSYQFK